ncbi:hypothetical protein [Nocardia sp. NPDC047038]|uniref:hypothetical protein n=1 Tax=Nocardia sp. NPDC047038 TaxID=3154338 RepID=UPI0033C13A06
MELRDEQLREALLARCLAERIEPTTPGRIDRLIGAARSIFEEQFCERTVSRLSMLSNDLIAVGSAPLASGRNLLAEWKSEPGKTVSRRCRGRRTSWRGAGGRAARGLVR